MYGRKIKVYEKGKVALARLRESDNNTQHPSAMVKYLEV